jgi:phosphatidylserine/phosphatidylglycerophosphate/cardiolipin synthase-like enzyme
VAIYEYELGTIVDAVQAAHKRGVKVRVIYHAKEGDAQTEENEHSLRRMPKASKRGRVTNKIFHNKFIVLSKLKPDGTRVPQAVLCGSTNFTENGVYRQANVVHVVVRPELAGDYLRLFDFLWDHPDDVPAARGRNSTENPISAEPRLLAGFSPRKGKTDLTEFVRIVESAERDVLFATVFKIYDPLLQALAGEPNDPILRYGVQNSRSTITGLHADRTAQFSTTAMLNRGLEGWLKETTQGQRGNILIHTKAVVTDFTSDAPTVVSGSHNLSSSASDGNDENYLIVRGDPAVADVYGIEILRLYDHYRFRFVRSQANAGEPPSLTEDDSWTDKYFSPGSLHEADRRRFAGR